LAMISDDIRYVYEFQLPGITETGAATKDAEELQRLMTTDRTQAGFTSDARAASVLVDRLNAFDDRYREFWQVVHGNTADAFRFRNDLKRTGEEGILDDEARAMVDLKSSLQALTKNSAAATVDSDEFLKNTLRVKDDLYTLHDVNVRYAKLSYQHVLIHAQA